MVNLPGRAGVFPVMLIIVNVLTQGVEALVEVLCFTVAQAVLDGAVETFANTIQLVLNALGLLPGQRPGLKGRGFYPNLGPVCSGNTF